MAELRAYNPTLRDRIASFFVGDERPSPEKSRLIEGFFGSRGMGNSGMGLVDLTPAGVPLWTQEYKRAQTPTEALAAALNFVPGAKGGKAVGGKLSAEAQRIRDEIAEILSQQGDDFVNFGLRVTEEPLEVGKAAPPSRVWVDGEPTAELLDGPSVHQIRTEADIERALAAAGFETGSPSSYYFGPHVSLIGSDRASVGEDPYELIFGDGGNVLRSWLKSFGPGREK